MCICVLFSLSFNTQVSFWPIYCTYSVKFYCCFQVGGDSCIFVWKLPTPLSSRMLQRIKESSDPLSPASMLLPLSSSRRILSLEEDYHLCEINPEDKSLPTDFNNVNRSVRQEKNHQETSAFKFSISRLPKWARSKVTSSEDAHGDAVVISSEVFHVIVVHMEGANYAEFLKKKMEIEKAETEYMLFIVLTLLHPIRSHFTIFLSSSLCSSLFSETLKLFWKISKAFH